MILKIPHDLIVTGHPLMEAADMCNPNHQLIPWKLSPLSLFRGLSLLYQLCLSQKATFSLSCHIHEKEQLLHCLKYFKFDFYCPGLYISLFPDLQFSGIVWKWCDQTEGKLSWWELAEGISFFLLPPNILLKKAIMKKFNTSMTNHCQIETLRW